MVLVTLIANHSKAIFKHGSSHQVQLRNYSWKMKRFRYPYLRLKENPFYQYEKQICFGSYSKSLCWLVSYKQTTKVCLRHMKNKYPAALTSALQLRRKDDAFVNFPTSSHSLMIKSHITLQTGSALRVYFIKDWQQKKSLFHFSKPYTSHVPDSSSCLSLCLHAAMKIKLFWLRLNYSLK